MKTIILAAAVICVAACGGTAVQHHATASPRPAASAPGAAACSRLSASALPAAAYDDLVTGQVGVIAGNGTASAADINAARAQVAAWIHASCPRFAYLLHG